jgi:DNA-binding winged helix-turn-helix (wHTH) protein
VKRSVSSAEQSAYASQVPDEDPDRNGTATHHLKVFISRLRTKLEEPGGHQYIQTERGLGYRFVRPPQGAAPPQAAAPADAPRPRVGIASL